MGPPLFTDDFIVWIKKLCEFSLMVLKLNIVPIAKNTYQKNVFLSWLKSQIFIWYKINTLSSTYVVINKIEVIILI